MNLKRRLFFLFALLAIGLVPSLLFGAGERPPVVTKHVGQSIILNYHDEARIPFTHSWVLDRSERFVQATNFLAWTRSVYFGKEPSIKLMADSYDFWRLLPDVDYFISTNGTHIDVYYINSKGVWTVAVTNEIYAGGEEIYSSGGIPGNIGIQNRIFGNGRTAVNQTCTFKIDNLESEFTWRIDFLYSYKKSKSNSTKYVTVSKIAPSGDLLYFTPSLCLASEKAKETLTYIKLISIDKRQVEWDATDSPTDCD